MSPVMAQGSALTPDSVMTPGGVLHRAGGRPFEVHLDVFQGPFEVLLGLISKHKLDITEIALAKVTDEFMAHLRAYQASDTEWDLSQASEFLLVAATLLDIKSARMLQQLGLEDEEDLALIEARDLLFARLLQYRAFKEVAAAFAERMATAGRMTARQAGLEPQFAALLPELVMGITPEQLGHDRSPGDDAESRADRRSGAPLLSNGQRPRAGQPDRAAPASVARMLLPLSGRRRRQHLGDRRAVPGPSRAVLRVSGRL